MFVLIKEQDEVYTCLFYVLISDSIICKLMSSTYFPNTRLTTYKPTLIYTTHIKLFKFTNQNNKQHFYVAKHPVVNTPINLCAS